MFDSIINFLTQVANVFLLSIFWIIGCLPIVTVGTSTAALYYTTVKVMRKDTGYLFREFCHSYKENLKSGIVPTIIMEIAVALMIFNLSFARKMEGTVGTVMSAIYAACIIILAAMFLYMFPILSRFRIKVKDLFRLTFFVTMKHILTTFLLLALFVLADFVLYMAPITLLIIPSILCLVNSLPLEKVLHKYMDKPEQGTEDAEKWYNR